MPLFSSGREYESDASRFCHAADASGGFISSAGQSIATSKSAHGGRPVG